MNNRRVRGRVLMLMLGCGGMAPVLGSCLSDQQASSILETVITTGLTTLVQSVVTGAVNSANPNG